MKRILFLLFSSLLVIPIYAQLNADHNSMRVGDVIIKQQVEFKDPGREEPNQVWDFSKLKSINKEYALTYSRPSLEGDSVYILGNNRYSKKDTSSNELIVGNEHNTMYYFRLLDGVLLQQGHENQTIQLEYLSPLVLMSFPLNYKQSITFPYISKGLYSGNVDVATRGTTTTTADAFGSIILPSGDTLSPVLRIKTQQTIYDISNELNVDQMDNKSGKLLETYKWYSKGYRYPVFETVQNINLADSTEIFSTAFFFPPQDHLYLDTDSDNLALLEELWDIDVKKQEDLISKEQKTYKLTNFILYKIYPNPVSTELNISYTMKKNVGVSFELYSISGALVRRTLRNNQSIGDHIETIDCSGLVQGSYILRVIVNNEFENKKIFKI